MLRLERRYIRTAADAASVAIRFWSDLKVPAARPSQASVKNAVEGIAAAGFVPSSVEISRDGSFRVIISDAGTVTSDLAGDRSDSSEDSMRTWDSVS